MRLYKHTVIAISSALLATIGVPLLNAQPVEQADPPSNEPARLVPRVPADNEEGRELFSGRIVKITNNKISIQPKDKEREVLVEVGDETVITLNRKPVQLKDLKAGDHVRVAEAIGQSGTIARIDAGRAPRVGGTPKAVERERRQAAGDGDARERLPAGELAALGVIMSDSPEQGVLLVKIQKDAPAWLSGLQAGDYLMRVDGRVIETPDDYLEVMRDQAPRGSVKLLIWREGESMSGTAEVVSPEVAQDIIVDNGLALLYQEDREARNRIDRAAVELESERRVVDGNEVPLDRRRSGFRLDDEQITRERFRSLLEENRRLKEQLEGRDPQQRSDRQDRTQQRPNRNETPQQQRQRPNQQTPQP